MSLQKMRAYADELERQQTGYDQGQRWSFNPPRDGSSVLPYKETDCSAGTAAIIRAGGFPLDTRDPIYTGNFRQKALDIGFRAIAVSGQSLASITSQLQAGDSLLGPGHIVFVYDKTKWWSAENDEYRRRLGGKAGDQTGMEARFRQPYSRSRGWQWVLRPPGLDVTPPTEMPKPEGVKPRPIEWQNPPADLIQIIQEITGAAVDGKRGVRTIAAVKRLQKSLKAKQDGEFGPGTAEAYLLSVPNLYKGRGGMPSGAVKLLQWIVRSRVDGQFGDLTVADLKSAQIWAKLEPDGNAGDETKRRITI